MQKIDFKKLSTRLFFSFPIAFFALFHIGSGGLYAEAWLFVPVICLIWGIYLAHGRLLSKLFSLLALILIAGFAYAAGCKLYTNNAREFLLKTNRHLNGVLITENCVPFQGRCTFVFKMRLGLKSFTVYESSESKAWIVDERPDRSSPRRSD